MLLKGLEFNTTYYYQFGSPATNFSRVFSFQVSISLSQSHPHQHTRPTPTHEFARRRPSQDQATQLRTSLVTWAPLCHSTSSVLDTQHIQHTATIHTHTLQTSVRRLLLLGGGKNDKGYARGTRCPGGASLLGGSHWRPLLRSRLPSDLGMVHGRHHAAGVQHAVHGSSSPSLSSSS